MLAVWGWRALAAVAIYGMLTLGVACASAVADSMLPPLQKLFAWTFAELWGSAAWGALFRGHPGRLPAGMAGTLLMGVAAFLALARARHVQARERARLERRRRELGIARSERARAPLAEMVRGTPAPVPHEDWM